MVWGCFGEGIVVKFAQGKRGFEEGRLSLYFWQLYINTNELLWEQIDHMVHTPVNPTGGSSQSMGSTQMLTNVQCFKELQKKDF